MVDVSEAFIDECLKYHPFSDYDSESDSSSDCRSELDDEYYQIIEKPIPVDELIRNTINSFHFEQCDSNIASCHPDSSAVAVTHKQSRDYVDYRLFGYEDEGKEKANDVVEQDLFCEVRKKRRRRKTCQKKFRDSQTTSNSPCDNNMYNCLLNKEDIVTKEENEEINNENEVNQIRTEICIKPQSKHKETEMGRKKESGKTQDKTSKKSRKKKKKMKEKEMDLHNSTAVNNNSNSIKEIDHNPIKVRRQTLDMGVSNSQKSSDFEVFSGSIYRSCSASQRYYKSAIPLTGFMPCKTAFELGDLLLSYTRFSGDCYQDIRSVVLDDKANVPTTKIRVKINNNDKLTPSWILHQQALLKPERDITEDSSLSSNTSRKRLSKNINSSDVKNATLREIKKGKKQIYHNDNNLYSWRATPNIIHWLSAIDGWLIKYDTNQISPNGEEQLQKNILTLPISQQTKIFPILHQIPRVMATEDERMQYVFEKRYLEYSQVLLSPFIPNVQIMDGKEIMQNIQNVIRNDFVISLILSGLEMFGLNIQQNLFGVALEFEVCISGVWINVETTDNLKYSTSRFRIICK